MDDDDRDEFLERSCSTVEESIATAQTVVGMITESVSLIDYALDYCLPLTACFKVTDMMRWIVNSTTRTPGEAAPVAEWNDGLSGLR